MSDARINVAAASGFTRGADDYERARPSYPSAVVALLADACGLVAGARVLDLAAGTGKLTRLLTPTGAEVIAVEPVAAMREQLAAILPDVEAVDGTAEAIPLDDASLDLVTIAQAFHWFDEAASLAELARVIAPAGSLALIWNVRDESVDWVHQFTELIVERGGGRPYTPYHEVGSGKAMTRGIEEIVAASGSFTPLEHRRFPNPQMTTLDDVVARAASTSFVAALPEGERARTLEDVRALLVAHPDVPETGEFVFPHDTDVYWCRRTA